MLIIHVCYVILECIRFLFVEFKKDWVLVPNLIDIVNIVFYQGSIFYISIVYVLFDQNSVEDQNLSMSLATGWLLVELITYYSQIVMAILFLAYSTLVSPIKPSKAMRSVLTKNRHHDYLTAT